MFFHKDCIVVRAFDVDKSEKGISKETVATIKFHDWANEFRVEVIGKFTGDPVDEVAAAWIKHSRQADPRRFSVDISRLSGYDTAGSKLLRQLYRHGVHFAAGTPLSLVFLNEISTPTRRGPALVLEPPAARKRANAEAVSLERTAAAGE